MSNRKLTRDIAAVLGSNISVLLLSLGTGIILARTLGPEGRGAFAALLLIPGMFAGIALLGTRQSALYFVGKKIFEDEKIVSSILITLIFSSVVGGSLCVLYFLFYPGLHFSALLITLAIAGIPTRLLIIYAGGFFLGKEKYRIMAQLKILPAILNLLFTTLFLLVFDLSLLGALLSMVVSNVLMDVYVLYKIRRFCPVRIRFYPEVQKQMIRMGLLYALSMMTMQLNYRVDILLLQSLSSFEQIGWYVLAASAAQQLWMFPGAIGVVVRTRTANEKEPGEMKDTVAQLLRISLMVCLIGGVALYFLGQWLLPFFYGDSFASSVPMLQAILPGALMMVFFKVLNNSFGGMGKPQITIFIFIPVMIVNILLNLWLIPLYGGIGAAWSSTASYSLGGIAVLIVYSALTHTRIDRLLVPRRDDFRFLLQALQFWKWMKRKKEIQQR